MFWLSFVGGLPRVILWTHLSERAHIVRIGESLKEKVTVLKSGIVHCDNCVIVIVVTGDALGELSGLVNL